ncbi:MAG: hypothetical protein ISS64_08915 [Desulfobacterales bacterium]|uniref:Uncharacterized protein n=1 Tax=Candidatus Desulfatibia profunda TaxID=2841695 RepID=A0A8J6NUV4_9BACT|nr:hypothetical protein [Candidatus Desulfatibia profunda]MBL7196395.1 hypothetical protein [Desulfobacterales bacterium]
MSEKHTDKLQDASVSFLEHDFNQCFEQVRYYDAQIVDIFKFLATFYTTVAGIAVGLYQFSIEKKLDLVPGLISGLSVAFLFGVCMFFLIVRNRVYFVFCMRYINEHRDFFLSAKPLGFENKSRMYTDYKKPPFFNILSSQSLWLYVVAILNSALLGVILYITKMSCGIITSTCAIVLLGQLISGIVYLYSRENKSASAAVFGK